MRPSAPCSRVFRRPDIHCMWNERPSAERQAFDALKRILYRWAPALDVVHNEPGRYWLNTRHIMKNKKPLFFGAVNIKKRYVGYHLMPVYVNPSLLGDLSDRLRGRMQGKSCFNFKERDSALFEELAIVTKAGYDFYQRERYV